MKHQASENELKYFRNLQPTREIIINECNCHNPEYWQQKLDNATWEILFADGTEPAFSHPLNDNKDDGLYMCAACKQPLFGSEAKYNSKTGWPSFYAPLRPEVLNYEVDYYSGHSRTAMLCSCCNGHIGHVFHDGPKPTNLRYCTNGLALIFVKE